MPFRQIRTILPLETATADAATRIVKLPLSNHIHSLMVYVACQLGSGVTTPKSIYDHTDLIEIIANGSEVLFSMSPREIHELHKALLDLPVYHYASSTPGDKVASWFVIPFGPQLWHTSYYLNCARFADLELRITYSPTIAATHFVSGTTQFMVLALMTLAGEPGPWAGLLRHTVYYDYETPASGDTTVDLPRRLPIAGILVFARDGTNPMPDIITNIALSLNAGQTVPINQPTWALKHNLYLNNPLVDAVFLDLSAFENNAPLNPKAYDVVQLILTNGKAGAKCRVVLEEILRV